MILSPQWLFSLGTVLYFFLPYGSFLSFSLLLHLRSFYPVSWKRIKKPPISTIPTFYLPNYFPLTKGISVDNP